MKKLLLTLFCVFSLFAWQTNAQETLTCTESFSASGTDAGPTILTITAAELSCNGSEPITSLKLTNAGGAFATTFCSTADGGWYGFDIDIDGVVTTDVCAAQLNDLDISGFTTLSITSSDNDAWPDSITISIDVEVTYPMPSCNAPDDVAFSSVTSSSATATWPAGAGATDYDWELVPAGSGQGVGVLFSGNTTNLTTDLSGLDVGTSYDFYIASGCSGDSSTWAGPFNLFTPYVNDACGGAIDLDTLTSPISATTAGATNDYTGGDCLTNTASPDLFYRVTVPAEYTLTIQQTSNAYDSKVRLAYGTSCPGDIVIACQDDPDTGVLSWVNDTGSDWEVYYVQSAYSTGSGAFVLDWSVEAPALDPPGCAINLLPADGAIDQSSSVGISWDQAADGVPVTSYDLYLSDGTTTDLALLAADWTSTAATLNNLNFGSTYYWQIIPKNDLGEAVGCVVNSFTVKSLPTGSSGVTCGTGDQEGSPFSESFDAQGDWTGDFGSSNDDWKFGTGPTGSADTGPSGPQDAGGSYIYWEASGSNTNSGAIVSPLIDLTAIEPGNDAELTFYMHAYGAGMGTLEVGASNSQAGPFTNIFTWDGAIQTASGDDWTQVGLDLSSYTGGNLYLEFKNTGIADYRGDMSIDTLTVTVCEEVPSCNYVSNISESNIDETSTTISFTDSNDPTPSNGWDYELLDITAGEVTGGGTLGNFTSTSNILSGLTGAGNDYEIIITTNCGGVFTDITSTPESFTWTQGILPGTACDSPIIAVAGTYSDVTVFDNAFNNTNSGADGAIWYSFTPTEDGTIDVSSCASDPTGVDTRLWLYTDGCTTLTAVDSDDDGCDSPNTYGSVVTGVAVSSGQEYLIEWDNRWESDEFDWTLTFTPLPDCADATNITQVQPTTTSATISWSDSVNPTVDGGYDYELLDITAGQVAGEGITGNSTTFSLELTGLIGSHNEYTINLTTVCNVFSNSPGTSFSWVQDPVLGYDCSAPITVLEGVNSAVFSAEGAGNIWYEFDAPADYGGTLSISACITGTDTYLQMWDDCDSFNSGSDDYCSLGSGLIDVPVARSQSYKFQWLNIYSSANFDFEFVFTPTPGSVCTAAIEAQVGTNTTNFTTSAGEVTIGGATDEVVHFSYTPVSDGVMTISSCDASTDTVFYIADGCGNYISSSDDDCGLQSTLTLSVTASQELKIYWTGWYNQDTFDWTLEYAASGSWTGATSTDWSESSNWATGALPSSSNDITIGTGLTNYPIIGSSTDANINNITVSSGASLTIDETSSLTVSGDFTNNGTVTLNSTEDDFSSLIVTGTASGDIVYNRYVNVYNDGNSGGWDLVCSPVDMTIADFITANGSNIEVLGSDYAFSQFNNATGQWERYATDSQTGSFTTGQGYSMATTTGSTVAFTGTMQTADQSINIINNNGLNGVGRRWNLVSNPFPSYISGNTAAGTNNFMDANSAVIDSEFLAVYGWNGSSYTIYNQLSGAFSMAPGQGFWVAALNTTDTALNFTAAMRTTTGTGDFVSSPQLLTYNVAVKLYNGETEKATTDFYFRDGLSLDLDPGYDAAAFNQSMALSTRLPQGSQETAFGINAMGMDAMQNTRVPLEIRQNAGQAFRVSIADMDLPEDIYVYLEDTLNGTLTSLKDGDFELVAQSNLSGSDRFFIVFKSNSVLSNDDTLGINALNVYKANTDSFVTIAGISPELGKLNVSLYNILGQTVREKALSSATATQRVSTQGLASGLYIVQIRSGNQTTVKKIIVK